MDFVVRLEKPTGRYTNHINTREKWTGYLWQGRFKSYVLDTTHLLMAARYIEMNPVKARIWFMIRKNAAGVVLIKAHCEGKDDKLCTVLPLLDIAGIDWEIFLQKTLTEEQIETLYRCERTGRPAGCEEFIGLLERKLQRPLLPQKRGPKFKVENINN